MMEWEDDGIVLAVRPHGETDAILTALTFEHGRHLGLVKGGISRRLTAVLQPGNRLHCVWRARLADHLGRLAIEPVRLYSGLLIDDPLRLAAVASACALVDVCLPEREPQPPLFAGLLTLLGDISATPAWPATFVRFELLLLRTLGYGLALERCAVSGATDDLAFVSPRSGRAVARAAAGDYAARLLPLPAFLAPGAAADAGGALAVAQGLRLAGHFLRRHILAPADRPLPLARDRFVDLWARQVEEKAG